MSLHLELNMLPVEECVLDIALWLAIKKMVPITRFGGNVIMKVRSRQWLIVQLDPDLKLDLTTQISYGMGKILLQSIRKTLSHFS